MAADDIRNTMIPAPYLPFKTFLSSLEPFSQSIPPRIDRTLWNQSGFTQGLIMNAYRYFHLVDVTNKPTPLFQQLVKSKNESRKEEIKKLIQIGYPDIVSLHDTATMTPKILDELMEKYNVTGETKKKAVTFFLQAAKFAEIPLSNFLAEKIRSTSGTRRRPATVSTSSNRVMSGTPSGIANTNTKRISLASNGTIEMTISYDPFSISKDDREFVFELIDKLQQYDDAHPSEGEDAEGQ
jgi:hypothetical protein